MTVTQQITARHEKKKGSGCNIPVYLDMLKRGLWDSFSVCPGSIILQLRLKKSVLIWKQTQIFKDLEHDTYGEKKK